MSLFALALLCSGCLRFSSPIDKDEGEKAGTVFGEAEFFSLERRQQTLLTQLIDERNATHATSFSSYTVGPEDVLDIQVFDVPELSSTMRVSPQGTISIPDVGNITVGGRSEKEVKDVVEQALSAVLVQPRVQVFIKEYASRKVSVIGEVARPGRYALKQNSVTLLDVLSEAGGRNQRAGATVLLIPVKQKKTANQHAASIEIRYDDLIGGSARVPLAIPLEPGDILVVPEAGMVQVNGEVQNPGSFQLTSRMSVLGAVASGGGLTYSADVDAVQVVRDLGDGKKAVLEVDLERIANRPGSDVRLRDGDVVIVPSQGIRFATRQVVDLINRVVNVGVSRSY